MFPSRGHTKGGMMTGRMMTEWPTSCHVVSISIYATVHWVGVLGFSWKDYYERTFWCENDDILRRRFSVRECCTAISLQ